jgi:hypothetical protein
MSGKYMGEWLTGVANKNTVFAMLDLTNDSKHDIVPRSRDQAIFVPMTDKTYCFTF